MSVENVIQTILGEWKLLLFLIAIYLLYVQYTEVFKFFEKKKIKFLQPSLLVGNLGPRLLMKQSFHDFQRNIYNQFKGYPYAGFFEGRRPVLVIMNLDLIKTILIRDFEHFTDRSSLGSREPPYANRSLLNLKGQEWKAVRSILTPTFSSARLRGMLHLVQQCSIQLTELLKQHNDTNVEMKDFLGHFTLEVIGACAFGIKCDALSDENANFVKIAGNFNYMSKIKRTLFFLVLIFMPKAMKFLNFSFFNPETAEELLKILTANKKERRSAQTRGNDFLQLMIDASEKERKEANENSKIYLDDNTIDAQSLLFLIAGFETSSTLLSFGVHVLATKPEIQDKLRAHIEEMTNGKELTYEVLAQMNYLEYFLMETLRMYPPVARLDRVCTKKYTLPGTNVNIEPGECVVTPIYGIHMDPDIYPEPEEFRPERFSEEEKKNTPHIFLGFGAGPRNCIGLRFAIITAKLAMIALVRNFKFTTCDNTVDPVQFDKKAVLLKAEKGLWVHVEMLKN